MVAPSSSTIAGPAWEAPAGSRLRASTGGVEEPAAEEHGPRLDPGAGEVSRHAPRAEHGLADPVEHVEDRAAREAACSSRSGSDIDPM